MTRHDTPTKYVEYVFFDFSQKKGLFNQLSRDNMRRAWAVNYQLKCDSLTDIQKSSTSRGNTKLGTKMARLENNRKVS